MRVNISYSVELDEVPEEVERMLIECNKKIKVIHGELSQLIGKDPIAIIKELNGIRLYMAETDERLDDCMQILNGYINTLSRRRELEQGPPSEVEAPPKEIKDE